MRAFFAPHGGGLKWNDEVRRILGTPEMRAFFALHGGGLEATAPEQFAA